MNTREKGRWGETMAVGYLRQNNYEIITKNYYTRWGEIDIVARDKQSGEIVFVEVKMRRSEVYGYPEEAVDDKKVEKMARAAEIYMEKTEGENNYRFDCLAILERIGEKAEIEHYKNIG